MDIDKQQAQEFVDAVKETLAKLNEFLIEAKQLLDRVSGKTPTNV